MTSVPRRITNGPAVLVTAAMRRDDAGMIEYVWPARCYVQREARRIRRQTLRDARRRLWTI